MALTAIQLELQKSLDAQMADSDELADDIFDAAHPLRFDPKEFLKELKKRANDSGVADEEHNENLMTLAILGTEEGQNLGRIKEKLSPHRRRFLKKMENIYRLVSGGQLSPKDATLTRISGCFAKEISLGIYNKTLEINSKVKPEMIAEGFPAFMCLSSFGSLIPPVQYQNPHAIYEAWLFHQAVFDEIINRGKEKTSKHRIMHFADRQSKSGLYSPKDRINHCLTVGLLEGVDGKLVISEKYRCVLEEAASKWRNLK